MKIDFFKPQIVAFLILVFLAMGYVGSFNYRFENPLSPTLAITVLISAIIFLIGVNIVKYSLKIENIKKINILSERLILAVSIAAIVLQIINLMLLGSIPLLNSTLKSNATTNLWRIAYPLFLIFINLLIAKHYRKEYLILMIIGALLFALNGYRTSAIGILASSFITLYYTDKISKKLAATLILVIIAGGLAIGYIASQSIANQNWTLNPIELVFYRAAFTLEVFEKIIPLGSSTHGHILGMIFSSGSPRTFIGNHVLHYNVCLTSTIFGPVYLDFGVIGLIIQMLFMGGFLEIIYKLKEEYLAIYSIILAHTIIWIETGPTDIMIWFLYLIAFILIILNFKNIKQRLI